MYPMFTIRSPLGLFEKSLKSWHKPSHSKPWSVHASQQGPSENKGWSKNDHAPDRSIIAGIHEFTLVLCRRWNHETAPGEFMLNVNHRCDSQPMMDSRCSWWRWQYQSLWPNTRRQHTSETLKVFRHKRHSNTWHADLVRNNISINVYMKLIWENAGTSCETSDQVGIETNW